MVILGPYPAAPAPTPGIHPVPLFFVGLARGQQLKVTFACMESPSKGFLPLPILPPSIGPHNNKTRHRNY